MPTKSCRVGLARDPRSRGEKIFRSKEKKSNATNHTFFVSCVLFQAVVHTYAYEKKESVVWLRIVFVLSFVAIPLLAIIAANVLMGPADVHPLLKLTHFLWRTLSFVAGVGWREVVYYSLFIQFFNCCVFA